MPLFQAQGLTVEETGAGAPPPRFPLFLSMGDLREALQEAAEGSPVRPSENLARQYWWHRARERGVGADLGTGLRAVPEQGDRTDARRVVDELASDRIGRVMQFEAELERDGLRAAQPKIYVGTLEQALRELLSADAAGSEWANVQIIPPSH